MEICPNIAVVRLDGDLDVTSVPRVKRFVEKLIDDGCRRIILNMSQVAVIDSAGMGLVLCEVRRMRSVGGLLSITDANERVLREIGRAHV